jgi:cellulose synthase operon protein C
MQMLRSRRIRAVLLTQGKARYANDSTPKVQSMKHLTLSLVAALLVPSLFVGCGDESPDLLIASAKTHLAKSENSAAVIQIKNALQANPKSAEGRYLLGVALFETGDPNGAELELRKALALGFSTELVVPKLAATMLAKGQYKKLIEEFAASKFAAAGPTADLQTSIAVAYGALGQAEPSNVALKAALAADPVFIPALLEQARQLAARSEFNAAMAAVERVIGGAPKSAEAWKLKGDLLHAQKGDQERVVSAYRQAIESRRDNLPAHFGLIVALVQQGRTADALKQLEAVKKYAAGHPQAKYLEALIAFRTNDLKQARALCQQLLKIAPNDYSTLILAGGVELQANLLLQAEALLLRAVQVAPKSALARRMLVSTYLRSNRPEKALAALHPGQSVDEISPELYVIAGETYLQSGDVKTAEAFYVKASKLDPNDARKRTSVAFMRLMGNEAASAFEELQAITASDTGVSAEMVLISAYLKGNEFEKALAAINSLERKQPDQPLAANLRGRTQLAMGDLPAARRSFERALTIAPAYFPATSNLAKLDLIAGKPEDAKKLLEALLAKDAGNTQALLAMAELLAMESAGRDKALALLERIISTNPTEGAPRLLQIELHLRAKDIERAKSAAQNAIAAIPDHPEILEALGKVQQAAGDINQAIATHGKLISLQPSSPRPHVQLADVYMAAKSTGLAERSLKKALELKPDLLEAQRRLALLYLRVERFDDAVAVARRLQIQRPSDPIGFSLEGDILSLRKDWDGAATAYRSGLKRVVSSVLAVKLHSLLTTIGKVSDAEVFSKSWLKAHSNDATFIFHLGDAALARKDFLAAEIAYITVSKLQPTSAAAFNNLAWISSQLHKDDAIALAEKANSLAPNQPAFIDTLAMVLSQASQFDRAISLQKQAIALDSANPVWKLSLAKIYVRAGDKLSARQELTELAAKGNTFGSQNEVATMLKSL